MLCENCGEKREQEHRKLCWKCTNWKKRYGTMNKDEVAERKENKRQIGRLTCILCEKRDSMVVPGGYTSTGKPMHAHCSWAAADFIEALKDPVKMYLLKVKLGVD